MLLIDVPGLAVVRGDDLGKKARDTFVITLVAVGGPAGHLRGARLQANGDTEGSGDCGERC